MKTETLEKRYNKRTNTSYVIEGQEFDILSTEEQPIWLHVGDAWFRIPPKIEKHFIRNLIMYCELPSREELEKIYEGSAEWKDVNIDPREFRYKFIERHPCVFQSKPLPEIKIPKHKTSHTHHSSSHTWFNHRERLLYHTVPNVMYILWMAGITTTVCWIWLALICCHIDYWWVVLIWLSITSLYCIDFCNEYWAQSLYPPEGSPHRDMVTFKGLVGLVILTIFAMTDYNIWPSGCNYLIWLGLTALCCLGWYWFLRFTLLIINWQYYKYKGYMEGGGISDVRNYKK